MARTKLIVAASLALGGCMLQTGQGAQEPAPAPPPQQPATVTYAAQPQAQPVATTYAVAPQPSATAVPVFQPAVMNVAVSPTWSTSNFGTISLSTGFLPDPHVVQGSSGGGEQAQTRSSDCRGWVTAQPDHLFVANTSFSNLRIIGWSSQDITLVIQGPDGSFRCNDDSEGLNPIVGGSFGPGTYGVWVGSYRQGVVAPYRLGFTEYASTTAASIGGGAPAAATTVAVNTNAGIASNFGTVSLRSGFVPDPHVVTGTSGGQIQAQQSVNPQCRGWITQRPDHVFVAETYFSTMRVMARSDQDVTLVVADQNGNVWCNDDSEGLNPLVAMSLSAGVYRVWVGSYRQGVFAGYRLGFSELSGVTPSDL
jgi:hypothetical protein